MPLVVRRSSGKEITMKKRLLFVLAIIVALSLIAAAPVSACNTHGRHRHQPPSGDQVMILNQNPDMSFGLFGREEISWFGTIVIDGKTFGMALYPDYGYWDPEPLPGDEPADDAEYLYGEWWKVFTGKFKAKDGVLKRCAPGRVLMSGYDEGIGSAAGAFESFGTVDYAAGYFKWWEGNDVRQDGQMDLVSVAGIEDAFGFNGTFETSLP